MHFLPWMYFAEKDASLIMYLVHLTESGMHIIDWNWNYIIDEVDLSKQILRTTLENICCRRRVYKNMICPLTEINTNFGS